MTRNILTLLSRREFISGTAFGLVAGRLYVAAGQGATTISQPPLPYSQNALAPYISENTMSFHYGKHHAAYVKNTANMIAGTELENSSLEEIIKKTAGQPARASLFNNAAQVFNHSFYWMSMKPGGGGEPQGKIAGKIKESFGNYQKFVEAFSSAATGQFGSGWAWLVLDGNKLDVTRTANAENPLTTSAKPLITIDVWEHAYYLDYQNRRGDYVKAFIENLLNWDFAEQNL